MAFYHLDFEQLNAGPTHLILEYDDSTMMVLTGRSATLSFDEWRQLHGIVEAIESNQTMTGPQTIAAVQRVLQLAFSYWED